MLQIVECIVQKELQSRHHTQLVANLLSKAVANVFGILLYQTDNHIFILCIVDTQVGSRNRQVGGNSHIRHGNHAFIDIPAVLQEDIGQFALQHSCDFLLSSRIHRLKFETAKVHNISKRREEMTIFGVTLWFTPVETVCTPSLQYGDASRETIRSPVQVSAADNVIIDHIDG